MKVGFLSLGCKTNSYDTETVLAMFEKRGYEIIRDHSYADIFIINTCSVTNIAERKSRQAVERVLKLNPDAVIVVTGCYAQVKPDEVKKLRSVAVVAGNRDRNRIVDMVEDYLHTREYKESVTDLTRNTVFEDIDIQNYKGRTRVQLKIQDGCNNFCSYCIIPYARGRICSKPVEKVLEQTRQMKMQGVKEIVLTGIHIASYGRDIDDGKYTLTDLIEQIHHVTEGTDMRIRLGSLDPSIVTEEFARRLSSLPRICPQFHLSLQSGSDTVLKRMNRHYTSEEFYQGVLFLREYFDSPALTADIIVGFPGETDKEFMQTLDFANKVGFAKIHIFPYSRREGTVAAKMPDQIPHSIACEREKLLSDAEKRMRSAYIDLHISKTAKVLFEEKKEVNGKTYGCGYTPEYIYVYVPLNDKNTNIENSIVNIRLIENRADFALGEFED